MLKKLSAVGVSCVTALVLMFSAIASPASVDAVTLEEMTSAAISCITSHEGTYDSINPNDCGAVSVGKLQWHADRALSLMRATCQKDTAFAVATLGETFYNEIMSATNWNYRTFSTSEASAAAALLGSSYGIQAQDETAAADVQNYIISGQNMGLTDAGALVLYSDIYNFGCGIAARIAKRAASYTGSYATVTLDDMYKAALNDSYGSNSAFVSRANNVYAYLTGLDWSATVTTTETTTTDSFSEEGAGTYTVTASSLNIRSGAGTGYSVVTQIPSGATVTVTATSGNWAAVVYGSFTGYCSLDYLSLTTEETVETEPVTTEETTTTTTTETVTTTTPVAEETTLPAEETTPSEEETVATTSETTTVSVEESVETPTETTTEWVETTETTETSAATETTTETTTTSSAVQTDVIVNSAYASTYGDVNCDGAVNVADAVMLQKYLSGSIQLNLEQMANGDCSYDNVLSTIDVIVILQHLVGHYTALPIV